MKRSIFYFSGTLLLALAAGCSSNVAPSGTSSQVNYVRGGTYVYYAQNLDANTGNPIAGSGDTITSIVLTTGGSYQGMSNVTEIQNTHSNAGAGVAPIDTTYIAQSNGDYWHYNYGLESLNTNQTVLNFNGGKRLVAGWILQAKLSATSGTTWIAADTQIAVGSASAKLLDTATEASDTIIVVGSSQLTAKHVVHHLNLNAVIATGTGSVDTYVSQDDGPALDIVHPALVASTLTPGRITILLKKE
ncbi:MAG: hypothetical protein ACHQNE_08875 [Candidatus Kapaibacterium sp.]